MNIITRDYYIETRSILYQAYRELTTPLFALTNGFDYDTSTEVEAKQLLIDFYQVLKSYPMDFGQTDVNAITSIARLAVIRTHIKKGEYKKAVDRLNNFAYHAILINESERNNTLAMLKEALEIFKDVSDMQNNYSFKMSRQYQKTERKCRKFIDKVGIKDFVCSDSLKEAMYHSTMKSINYLLDDDMDIDEKLNILQFLIKCVVNDECTSYAGTLLYGCSSSSDQPIMFPFAETTGERCEIDFAETPVICFPWESSRFKNVIKSFMRHGFDADRYC